MITTKIKVNKPRCIYVKGRRGNLVIGAPGISPNILSSDVKQIVSSVKQSIFFASSSIVSDFNYLGIGSSSSSFIKNTITMPSDAVLTNITFHIRSTAPALGHGARVTLAKAATPNTVTFPGLDIELTDTQVFASEGGENINVSQGDLVSIQIFGGPYSDGVAVTLSYTTL
jgi:hypothetical protein